jgi:hypothetical protein
VLQIGNPRFDQGGAGDRFDERRDEKEFAGEDTRRESGHGDWSFLPDLKLADEPFGHPEFDLHWIQVDQPGQGRVLGDYCPGLTWRC